MKIPIKLERSMHPRADRKLAARILELIGSTPAVCIADVRTNVGCADATALKHLLRMKEAGLVSEKRIGRARVFIRTDACDSANLGGDHIDRP
ncbi:MAG: hypothetical protein ABR985_07680 [Methanotrichaceae archaeon]|jgi:predicted transcriptional regulator